MTAANSLPRAAPSTASDRDAVETELVELREKLRMREQELAALYRGSSGGVFSLEIDEAGIVRFAAVNEALLGWIGAAEHDVVGQPIEQALLPARPATRRAFVEHVEEARRDGSAVRWVDGAPSDERVYEIGVGAAPEPDGSCRRLFGTVHDVTERARAEETRTRLAAIVEGSDDAIVSKTLEGVIVTWNPGAQRMFGYEADEVIGKPITILIPPERADEEPAILARLRRGERIDHYETVRVTKDGRRIDVSLTVSPVRSGGVIVGVSKIARDISDRRRAEAALQEEARTLELLADTWSRINSELALDAVAQAVIDIATRVSGARRGAFFYRAQTAGTEAFVPLAVSGMSQGALDLDPRSPILARTFRGEPIVRSDDLSSAEAGSAGGMRSYLAIPVTSRSGEVVGGIFLGHPERGIFTRRTERIVVAIAGQAALAIGNARLYETTRDVAADRARLLGGERAARAEAERASRMKDEFLATLSHELRTPLHAILGWAQLLRSDRARLDHGLLVIERSAKAQQQLIEDLLDMSRITSGKVKLELERVDTAALLRSAVESVRHAAEQKKLRLSLALDPDADDVLGDPARLQQCVWNLLSNAIKFTGEGSAIRVSLSRAGDEVEISVADEGRGIDPEFLPHVFERFRQGDSSTTRTEGGLGLGLAIVKQLVELHGGRVRATSAGRGMGATFSILLPRLSEGAEVSAESSVRTSPPTSEVSLEGLDVLVVDDELDSRFFAQVALETRGARVAAVQSVREALGAMGAKRFDVVVSDIGMPEEDGYELIRRVRALPPGAGGDTPVVALTAFARSEDGARAMRAGFQAHVPKPVEPLFLASVVARLAAPRADA